MDWLFVCLLLVHVFVYLRCYCSGREKNAILGFLRNSVTQPSQHSPEPGVQEAKASSSRYKVSVLLFAWLMTLPFLALAAMTGAQLLESRLTFDPGKT